MYTHIQTNQHFHRCQHQEFVHVNILFHLEKKIVLQQISIKHSTWYSILKQINMLGTTSTPPENSNIMDIGQNGHWTYLTLD